VDEEDSEAGLSMVSAALLHLLRASLESDIAGQFKSVMLFEPKEIEKPLNHTQLTLLSLVLLNPKNRNLQNIPYGETATYASRIE